MSTLGKIIVSDVSHIESIIYPPNYNSSINTSNFPNREELFFSSVPTYEEFLDLYQKLYSQNIHISHLFQH